jgi:hypothetical protein
MQAIRIRVTNLGIKLFPFTVRPGHGVRRVVGTVAPADRYHTSVPVDSSPISPTAPVSRLAWVPVASSVASKSESDSSPIDCVGWLYAH